MASKTDIFRMTLARIGEVLISDPNGQVKGAEYLRVFYDMIMDELLRSFQWNFAAKRTTLALTTETPVGYDYAYTLPDDCLLVRWLLDADGNRDDTYEWEVESGELLTDMEDARVLYTRSVPDPNDFDALFTSMFTARLAAEVCPAIKPRDGKKQASLWQIYERLLTQAKYADAKEKKKPPKQTNRYVTARGATTEDEDE